MTDRDMEGAKMYQAVKVRKGKWLIEDTRDGDRTTISYRTKREAARMAEEMNAWMAVHAGGGN